MHRAGNLGTQGCYQFSLVRQCLLFCSGPHGCFAITEEIGGNNPVSDLQCVDQSPPMPITADGAVHQDNGIAGAFFQVINVLHSYDFYRHIFSHIPFRCS